jgi:hypothetical protein
MLPLNGFAPKLRPQTLLVSSIPPFCRSASLLLSRCLTQILFQYYLSGLTNDTHTITLTNTETNSSKSFDLDRFVVSQYFTGSTPASTSGSQRSSSTGGRFASHRLALVIQKLTDHLASSAPESVIQMLQASRLA